jgi:hypothetical protein
MIQIPTLSHAITQGQLLIHSQISWFGRQISTFCSLLFTKVVEIANRFFTYLPQLIILQLLPAEISSICHLIGTFGILIRFLLKRIQWVPIQVLEALYMSFFVVEYSKESLALCAAPYP